MPTTKTPLRYPGGKSRLAPYVGRLIEETNPRCSTFAEPYAGGAGVSISILLGSLAERVYINDINKGVSDFWKAVATQPNELCDLIESAELSIAEWERQRLACMSNDTSSLLRGFATFYLNRTNRSGILLGGIIGGRKQSGKWTMGARFNKETAISKIRAIANHSDRIEVSNLDASCFLRKLNQEHGGNAFYFIDPPYFNKTDDRLYINTYSRDDHKLVASAVAGLRGSWVVTYDNSPEIRELYKEFPSTNFRLNYSAGTSKNAEELMIYSADLNRQPLPDRLRSLAKTS